MDVLDRFSAIVAASARPFVVELGAHNGHHTELLVGRLRAAGKPAFDYTAVEPDARVLPQLRGRRLPITILGGVAVGARDETAAFWVSGGTHVGYLGSSSIRKPTGHLAKFPSCTFEPSTIEVRTLDTICRTAASSIDFIWADIQGAEVDLIEGGRRTLARTRYLYTEHEAGLYEGSAGLDGILARLPGWELVENYGYDALLRNNVLAVP